ncbi:hypothetical protein LBMAG38_11800 [Chloroflexota bacterium]|nr:hypothetical protein LBMAG38_11800 [Chloroflexota bacterium]
MNGFWLGVAASVTAQYFAPAITRLARPVALELVRQALVLGRGAGVRGAELQEHLEDLVAEARHGLGHDVTPAATGGDADE